MNARTIACLGILSILAPIPAWADTTAKAALARIENRIGEPYTRHIVKIKALDGVPNPKDWQVTGHDPTSPTKLREFMVGGIRAVDLGINNDFYPRARPTGFVKREDIQLDSIDAFSILNREANKAKIGFDSVNYLLRCREFSTEPIWTLSAIDSRGRTAGVIDISAKSGELLRTTWFRESPGSPFRDKIEDSALANVGKKKTADPAPNLAPLPDNPLRDNLTTPAIEPVNPTPEIDLRPKPSVDSSGNAIDTELPDVVPVE